MSLTRLKLRLEPVDVLFFVVQDVLEQVAADVIGMPSL
jgi:hypothetical protein